MAKNTLLLASMDKHDPSASPEQYCYMQIPCLDSALNTTRVESVLDVSVYSECRSRHFCWVH